MGPSDLQRYKKLLLEKRRELSFAQDDAEARVPAAGGLEGDLIDQANADAEAELQIRLLQTDGRLTRAIEEALVRIEKHTYGVCEACGQPISKVRLNAVPWTRHCRECKEREHSADLRIGIPGDQLNSKKEDTLMQKWTRMFFVALLGAVFVAGTSQPSFAGQVETKDKVQMGGEKLLYDRLGGKTAITAVVDEFVGNVAADARINKFFAVTASDPKRMATFKGNLVDQICQAGSGPCKYAGKSMKVAHKGMGISSADFSALVEDLVKALDKFKVGEKEKNELLSVLGPMKSDIVEKP